MPSVIPYDPSLVLGNIVSEAKLDVLNQISALQAPVDVAEDTLNSFISMKRSLDMTVQEMINMGIDSAALIRESNMAGKQISDAAIAYAKLKLAAEKNSQPLRAKIQSINSQVESPIDYNKSEIKKLPLSSDSLKMNCQYFAFDSNSQSSGTHAATVASFAAAQVNYFGNSYASQVKFSAQSQVNSQHSNNSIAGTLVISITCTHKNAAFLAPLILDPDKAIRVWNQLYPSDSIRVSDPHNLASIAMLAATAKEKSITMLSGCTYGSCFIGMVHILNTTDTQSSERMYSLASAIQAQGNVGSWWANISGGFGISSSFSQDAKNLLSAQNVTSHCSLISLGAMPSMKSNEVQMAVKAFSDDDAAKSMAALQKIQNATASDMTTIDSAATNARTGQQMITIQSAKITATLSGLSDIDKSANKMIDTNSMMTAVEDYINKCIAGNIGVPINFYLKPITKSQLAQMWLRKYYPKYNNPGSGDDSGSGGSGGGASSSQTQSADTSSQTQGGSGDSSSQQGSTDSSSQGSADASQGGTDSSQASGDSSQGSTDSSQGGGDSSQQGS